MSPREAENAPRAEDAEQAVLVAVECDLMTAHYEARMEQEIGPWPGGEAS